MIHRTVHAVRTTIRQEFIEAVIQVDPAFDIASVEPESLWFWLVSNGILPQYLDEDDTGINLFWADHDPQKHADFPIVDLSEIDNGPLPATVSPIDTLESVPTNGSLIIRLTREIELDQVKRVVVNADSAEQIGAVSADDFWWGFPQITAIDDEYIPDASIALDILDSDLHSILPVVAITEFFDEMPSHEFLYGWQPASSVTQLDKVESERVQRLIRAYPNNCYCNARRALRSLPDHADASYVEGFVVTADGAMFEHGWIVKDGRIVEPTLIDERMAYFAGVEWKDRAEIRRFLQTEWGSRFHGRGFHFAFYSDDDILSPSFWKAGQQAALFLHDQFGWKAVDVAMEVRGEDERPWPKGWLAT